MRLSKRTLPHSSICFNLMSNFPPLHPRPLRCTALTGNSIMASSSRELPINRQNISGLTVNGGRLFAGSNTTNHIYNGWCSLDIEIIAPLMLHSGPVNLRHRAASTKKCMLVLGGTFILFSNLQSSQRKNTLIFRNPQSKSQWLCWKRRRITTNRRSVI